MSLSGVSKAVLGVGAAAFLLSCYWDASAIRGAGERAQANAGKKARIESLDAEYKAYLEEEVATGRLLDQTEKRGDFLPAAWFASASKDVGLSAPVVSSRMLDEKLGRCPLCEISVKWGDVPPAHFQTLLEKAESEEPPMRLRSADIKARTGGRASIEAVFWTLSR